MTSERTLESIVDIQRTVEKVLALRFRCFTGDSGSMVVILPSGWERAHLPGGARSSSLPEKGTDDGSMSLDCTFPENRTAAGKYKEKCRPTITYPPSTDVHVAQICPICLKTKHKALVPAPRRTQKHSLFPMLARETLCVVVRWQAP